MMLAPLPSWRALARATWGKRLQAQALAQPWMRGEQEVTGWLSRSAWSLALVAMWRRQADRDEGDGNLPCVWVPDYFCNASLAALRQVPARLHFYPVTEQLRPDYKVLRQVEAPLPDIFLLVHYFGMPSPASEAREFCKRTGAWLVEDAAHVLQPLPGMGTEADFILYSPHKLLALPEGSLLVARGKGASKLGEEGLAKLGPSSSWPLQLQALAAGLAASGAGSMKWLGKRLLQKLGARARLPVLAFGDDSSPARLPAPKMSALAQRLLAQAVQELPAAATWRRRNQLVLDELAQVSPQDQLEPAWRPGESLWIPYMATYRSPVAEAAFSRLRGRGVPATTWPDLAPEVLTQPQAHVTALALRASHLFLPIHQSLRLPQLQSGFAESRAEAHASENIDISPVRDGAQWQQLLQVASGSNLLQSWSYGQSKANTGSWHVQRLVLSQAGRPLAIAQVLQKKLGGVLSISRINRGPLFLPAADAGQQQACFRRLAAELGRLTRGRVLSWAPEARLTGEKLLQLDAVGFRLLSPRGWSSSMIDLGQEEAILRSGLSGNWRNMLNVAQRKLLQPGVRIDELDDESVFEPLLENCVDMMRERGVHFPVALYRDLRQQLERDGQPGMLLAMRNGEQLLAATWAVPHGDTATYLLGWSGEEGRKLHAHHLLLWETLLRLKARGLRYFDLGGIDDERTGGIAAFKLGMGGKRYSLVGEGWCC